MMDPKTEPYSLHAVGTLYFSTFAPTRKIFNQRYLKYNIDHISKYYLTKSVFQSKYRNNIFDLFVWTLN